MRDSSSQSISALKRYFTILTLGGFVTWLASSASAASSGPFNTLTPIASKTTDWSLSPTAGLEFPQFNTALGTLTSVELDLSATIATKLTIKNNTSGAISGGFEFAEVLFNVSGVFNDVSTSIQVASPNFYVGTLFPGQSATSQTLNGSGSKSSFSDAGTDLSGFIGTGDVSFGASTQTHTLPYGSSLSFSQATSGGLTGDIIYTYTPTAIPEPATYGVVASVGLFLLSVRRPSRKLAH